MSTFPVILSSVDNRTHIAMVTSFDISVIVTMQQGFQKLRLRASYPGESQNPSPLGLSRFLPKS